MELENYSEIYALEKTNWWYKARRHLLNGIIATVNPKPQAILDAGCGVGSNLEVLAKYSSRVYGVDFSKTALQFCEGKGYTKLFNASLTDFQSDTLFDLIICADVLEHLDDDRAVKNIKKCLSDQGTVVFSVPAHRYLWNVNDDFSHHLRRYEPKELTTLLSNNGFKITRIGYWNFTTLIPALLYAMWYQSKKRRENIPLKNNLNLIPKFLNSFLFTLLKMENFFFMKCGLINGVSLVCICRK